MTKTDNSYHPGISLFINYVQNFVQHPSVEAKITGHHQGGFWCNWSNIDHKFFIYQILNKKVGIVEWGSASAIMDFKGVFL